MLPILVGHCAAHCRPDEGTKSASKACSLLHSTSNASATIRLDLSRPQAVLAASISNRSSVCASGQTWSRFPLFAPSRLAVGSLPTVRGGPSPPTIEAIEARLATLNRHVGRFHRRAPSLGAPAAFLANATELPVMACCLRRKRRPRLRGLLAGNEQYTPAPCNSPATCVGPKQHCVLAARAMHWADGAFEST